VGNFDFVGQALPPLYNDCVCPESHLAPVYTDCENPLGEMSACPGRDYVLRFIVPSLALAGDQFSSAALRQAANRGRLDAVQGVGGTWRSTRRAERAYVATKGRHRGGKR
jgi:hypothetical protein